MSLRPLEMFKFFQRVDRLYTSDSDVYRRQILGLKTVPALKGFYNNCINFKLKFKSGGVLKLVFF